MKKTLLKRSKIYIIIAVVIAASLFSTAALCNGCGLLSSSATTDSEKTDETTSKETSRDTSRSDQGDNNSNGEKSKPTIKLEIYKGPSLDEDSGFCYYRIEAKVTGNPKPEVDFSKDDSNNAWGDYKVQINIENPGDTYTLIATAKNSEGEDSASLDLDWGCDGAGPEPGPEPEPEPGPEISEEEITIAADVAKSGYISDGFGAFTTWVYMGDNISNKEFKGYLTFSLSGLLDMADVTIIDVRITIPGVEINEKPWEAGDQIVIKVRDYGPTIDYPADLAVGGTEVKTFVASDAIDNLDFSTAALKDELQNAISIGKELFQLKFGLNGVSANGKADWYKFRAENAEIYIKYNRVANAL